MNHQKTTKKKLFNNCLFLILSLFIFSACEEKVAIDELSQVNHLELGNPSQATDNQNIPNNYLLIKPQFTLSYNQSRGTANWVSWHLSKAWQGVIDRQDDFRTDTDLPSNWYRVSGSDYSGSGFDRGHLCPSADRTRNARDNSATFVMSNMLPQAPDHNRGPWAELESYCRSIVNSGNWELYIIAGGYGKGGEGSNGSQSTLQNGKITIPKSIWKIIVVLPLGDNDAKRITSNTRIIAIDMPNVQGIKSDDWRMYRTTVDEIEKATGFDFLNNVSTDIQKVIEKQMDTQ